jgi:predicted nucleotide-binding protein (sugar kinase/HSP70/actin superfamily)
MVEKMENKEKRKVGEDNCGNVVWGVSKKIDKKKMEIHNVRIGAKLRVGTCGGCQCFDT